MKKILLAALNAKYIHSNLALRYLSKFQDNEKHHHIVTMEFTINQRVDFIAEEIFRQKPDVVLFSCYIWNVEELKEICPILKKILPDCVIGFGGPEVSYDSKDFLRQNPAVDLVMRGEGEQVFTELLDWFDGGGPKDLEEIRGLTFRQGERILSTPPQPPLDLALLPFPYAPDLSDMENQIIYYETSRGCPYQCGYCLSSVEQGVRFVPLEKALPDLQKFLDAKVRQVKFIDRTFNCKKSHAMAIWSYLHEHDNGITNFHFEITADLLDQETIDFLKRVRRGLFQFEIGVQTTNPRTMEAIRRNVDFEVLSERVRQIKAGENIHQHLDLIAGLPFEDYASFGRSFNDVYALAPEQLQLGFLKLLKGSMLHQKREEYGIITHDTAPYEVLETDALPFVDTLRLKYVEEMVETYYNSGRFLHSLEYLVPLFESPFAFYEALAEKWVAEKKHYISLSKFALCDFLWDFSMKKEETDAEELRERMRFDFMLHERPNRLPDCLKTEADYQWREKILSFYGSKEKMEKYLPHYAGGKKQAAGQTHLAVMNEKTAVLFDYGRKDLLGNAAVQILPIEVLEG
ncbi:B12-binding domain-containing radical SAM protein [Anaerotignum lactatifermentans]|uniref:B12-binding domain-containing radical SAM protein n=1 Tax=Anaerotignum lactatifermentans TaxID=160404 RepID=UPI002ED2A604